MRLNKTIATLCGIALMAGLITQACGPERPVAQEATGASHSELPTLAALSTRTTKEYQGQGTSSATWEGRQEQPADMDPSPAMPAQTRQRTLVQITEAQPAPTKGRIQNEPTQTPDPKQWTSTTPISETRLPVQEPSIPAEYEEFLNRITSQDRNCLPGAKHSDIAIVAQMRYMDGETWDATMQCLTGNGQSELHVLMQTDKRMSREAQRCVWDGLHELQRARIHHPGPDRPLPGRTDQVAVIATSIIRGYCAREETDGADPAIPAERWELLYCIVDAAGGPAPFVEWMLKQENAPQVVAAAIQGESECTTAS